jgi:hypothetical protein
MNFHILASAVKQLCILNNVLQSLCLELCEFLALHADEMSKCNKICDYEYLILKYSDSEFRTEVMFSFDFDQQHNLCWQDRHTHLSETVMNSESLLYHYCQNQSHLLSVRCYDNAFRAWCFLLKHAEHQKLNNLIHAIQQLIRASEISMTPLFNWETSVWASSLTIKNTSYRYVNLLKCFQQSVTFSFVCVIFSFCIYSDITIISVNM